MKHSGWSGAVIAMVAATLASTTLPGTAHATSVSPTTTLDVVDPNDGLISLREAIAVANSDGELTEIVLTAGQTYVLDRCGPAPDDSNEFGDLDHGALDTLIVRSSASSNATIIQTCPGERILHDGGGVSLHLVGLTMTGGTGHPGGGAVLSNGPTEIRNSTFTRNSTDAGGADPMWTLTGGGAVASLSTVNITFSTFIGNRATHSSLPVLAQGGAVWARLGGSVVGSRFEGNDVPTGSGGALMTWSGIEILRSKFTGNAAVHGGAVRIFQPTSSTSAITDSTFTSNSASNNGGAVSVSGCGTCGTSLTVTRGSMTGNTAGVHGGALAQELAQGGWLTITAGRYWDNHAGAQGGAFRLAGGSQVSATITDAAVSQNTAGSFGGAIHSGFLDLTITRGIFEENRAGASGGVLSTNATIFGGSLGDPQIVVDGAAMLKNRADVDGGAIHHPTQAGFGTPVLTVSNSALSDNVAKGDGGAIFGGPNRPVQIRQSSIVGNIARRGGGVAFAGPTMLDNVTLAQNSAVTGGGVLALGDIGRLTQTTLFRNKATSGAGSALTLLGGGVRLRGSAITFGSGAPCSGTPQSQGGNVVNGNSCGLTSPVDLQTSALLQFTLVSGAAVPGATNPVVNFYGLPCALPVDQRGIGRPQGGKCDTGAVERVASDPALGDGEGDSA